MPSKKQNETAIAVDNGATNLRVALITKNGKILKHSKIKTPKDANRAVEKIESTIKKTFTKDDIRSAQAIGISIAGPVDKKEGTALLTNIGMKKISFVQTLKKDFEKNIFLINDGEAAVLGEKFFSDRKARNILFITISTGIGGAAIKDSKLKINKEGIAGEVGHQKIGLRYNLRCPCGGFDHWEAYGSGMTIGSFFKTWAKDKKYDMSKYRDLDVFSIFKLARSKDPAILEFLEEIGRINALGIEMAIKKHHPELIILGGSVFLNNQKFIFEPLKRNLKSKMKIVPTNLGDNAPLLGAAAYVFETLG